MNETALIERDDSRFIVRFLPEADAMKTSALELAALIGKVKDAYDQEAAVNAQKEIKRVLKLAEDSRKAIKEPVLDYGRRIDDTAKAFIAELRTEEMRIAKLIGDFQALELAKQRAAEAAQRRELEEIERRKQAELSKAESHEQLETIQARYSEEAAAVPSRTPVKAASQIVKEEWEIEITDAWLLARAHPACVDIQPRIREIKALLDAGVKVAGICAKKVVKSTVRLGRESALIEA